MSRALQRRENIAGYLFMLPSLIFFLGFVIIPMFICIITSLTSTITNVFRRPLRKISSWKRSTKFFRPIKLPNMP